MANISITLKVQPTRPTASSGKTRQAAGNISLSKNSKWPSSGIERLFNRCYGITVAFESPGGEIEWKASATHLAGILQLPRTSTMGKVSALGYRHTTNALSGYFQAVGI